MQEKFIPRMQTTRWNRKRLALCAIGVWFIYMILSSGYRKYQIDAVIENTKPEDVWEFVADFSKMKQLNPTILDFKITADTGNYDHWKYSVLYEEKLSHWPYWINLSTADYAVRKISQQEGAGNYVVESEHKTCFFGGLYCLKSQGEFRFSPLGKDTYCVESVLYQCPIFLGSMCKREVEFQRQSIMKNLALHFNKKHS